LRDSSCGIGSEIWNRNRLWWCFQNRQ
jgi:hypothetical protein